MVIRYIRTFVLSFLAGSLALAPIANQSLAQATRGAVFFDAPDEGLAGLQGTTQLYENSYAIVVGIDNYNALPQLNGAARDANAVAEALEGMGFSVIKILNEEATRAKITETLGDRIPNVVRKNDRVLVYFAGHGVSTGQEGSELGYLMPVEGDKDKVRSSGISMRELQNWFADYSSKHVMFVADACYSGLALSTRSVGLSTSINNYLAHVTDKPVRIAITAGGKGEVAHEWQGHGLFTHYFLEGIKGGADVTRDGVITSDELAAYIKPKVTQTAMTQFSAKQNPQIGRSGEGEFVFVIDPADAPAESQKPKEVVTRKASDRPTGLISIVSDPKGASISAGQNALGITPWEGKIETGAYTFLVQKEGYKNQKHEVFIEPGKTASLNLSLQRDREGFAWPWLVAGIALAGVGVVADVVPNTASNDQIDGADFVPTALYAVGGVALVFSFTF